MVVVIKRFGWGYCGFVRDNINYVIFYYDVLCYDQCVKREEDYYWCNMRKGWDYCFLRVNVDYKNKFCKEDS